MTKQKSTKKAFLGSILSLVLCMAMLIGTTFACARNQRSKCW